jgi:hypothetical protein
MQTSGMRPGISHGAFTIGGGSEEIMRDLSVRQMGL